MQRVVISVPRILAWVKRQPPERVIGVTGSPMKCIVTNFARETYGFPYVRTQPSSSGIFRGTINLASENEEQTRPLPRRVSNLAIWFDHIRSGSTGQEITAGEFLAKWQARDE